MGTYNMFRVCSSLCLVGLLFASGISEVAACTHRDGMPCDEECGKIRQPNENDTIAGKGELPWHVVIYHRPFPEHLGRICSGSIISSKLIITAAQCFHNFPGSIPEDSPEHFAVAAGKLFSDWNNPSDDDAQKRNITDIKISESYNRHNTNFQGDIALLVVSTPFVFNEFVKPICIDFDVDLEERQLEPGNLGKIASYWSNDTEFSIKVRAVELPYLDKGKCISDAPRDFRGYIRTDKICTGFRNGSEVCRADLGSGLAFPTTVEGVTRYYLRGILSVSSVSKEVQTEQCSATNYTGYTHLAAYEGLIRRQLWELEAL